MLSVVVLSFNTRELLHKCLTSVFGSSGIRLLDIEVIVVDNGSTDGSDTLVREQFKSVRLLRCKKNLGYSAGNNVGIKASRGSYVLLLNSDVFVAPDALSSTLRFEKSDSIIGAATCRLVLADGKVDPASHRGFPTPWNAFTYLSGLERLIPKTRLFGGYHQGWKDLTVPHEVDAIAGAFFLIPRTVIESVGMFDERFFMYGEDLDWCFRIKKSGFKILYYPLASALHLKKQSGRSHQSNRAVRRRTQHYFIDAMELFYRKHYIGLYPKPLSFLVLSIIRLWKLLP